MKFEFSTVGAYSDYAIVFVPTLVLQKYNKTYPYKFALSITWLNWIVGVKFVAQKQKVYGK